LTYDDGVSGETVGGQFPAVVTLDDLAAMNAADRFGHRYELSPHHTYDVAMKMPLAWLLLTKPADHNL